MIMVLYHWSTDMPPPVMVLLWSLVTVSTATKSCVAMWVSVLRETHSQPGTMVHLYNRLSINEISDKACHNSIKAWAARQKETMHIFYSYI